MAAVAAAHLILPDYWRFLYYDDDDYGDDGDNHTTHTQCASLLSIVCTLTYH